MRAPLDHALEGRRFRVAVVLGSGLSDVAGSLVGDEPIPYSRIDGMPASTVEGHEGALYAGDVAGVATLVFAGRVHLYEGYDAAAVTFAVRSAASLGCEAVILTNAAGGIADGIEIGVPCLIDDHLNLTGTNPLTGEAAFIDMSDLYDPALRALAREIDPELGSGIYAGVAGPTYETPAEIRMLATLGADVVGMSTVLEAIAARAAGMKVLGVSVVTNRAAGLSAEPVSHEEVATAGRRAAGRLEPLLRGVIARI